MELNGKEKIKPGSGDNLQVYQLCSTVTQRLERITVRRKKGNQECIPQSLKEYLRKRDIRVKC